jgi:superfamily I DNA and/or RNA helicase
MGQWPGLEVSTVDSFQGQERDIMVLSLTRSNPDGTIGFLAEYRRTNVAMTRARKHLLVVGDGATLGADPFFGWLIGQAEAAGAYRSAWDYVRA